MISDDELAVLNDRDFKKDGCAFYQMTDKALARKHGLRRRWSGGETGRLLGYERIKDDEV